VCVRVYVCGLQAVVCTNHLRLPLMFVSTKLVLNLKGRGKRKRCGRYVCTWFADNVATPVVVVRGLGSSVNSAASRLGAKLTCQL
jgi:hypothetical protein